MSPGAKRFAKFLASQPNASEAKLGLPVNADRLSQNVAGLPNSVNHIQLRQDEHSYPAFTAPLRETQPPFSSLADFGSQDCFESSVDFARDCGWLAVCETAPRAPWPMVRIPAQVFCDPTDRIERWVDCGISSGQWLIDCDVLGSSKSLRGLRAGGNAAYSFPNWPAPLWGNDQTSLDVPALDPTQFTRQD
jgi:hypothetical protein